MPSLEQQARDIADHYQPPPIGTHSIITDVKAVEAFLKAIRDGNYLETSAKLAGISKSAIYEWLERAEQGEDPYTRFADALKNAEAMAEAQDVANVRAAGKAGPQFWAASMTYLERRHPERWGKRQDESSGPKVIVQIGVKDSDVQIQMISVSPSSTTLSPPLSEDIHRLSADESITSLT